jgi:hypothetical protein
MTIHNSRLLTVVVCFRASNPHQSSPMQPSLVSVGWRVFNRPGSATIELQKERVNELERRVRQHKLDEAARQAELESEAGEASDPRKKYRELSSQARRRRLDNAAAERLEERRERQREQAQQAAARGEKSRLNSLASVEQARELWRLKDNDIREKKRLRDEAGIRAVGAFKRPLAG